MVSRVDLSIIESSALGAVPWGGRLEGLPEWTIWELHGFALELVNLVKRGASAR
jgi:hypothetical protein